MSQYLLVRHGTTDWVEKRILHGVTDIPLNAQGLQQAREAASALASVKAKALYASPLSRCRQTAEIISENLGLAPIYLESLREMDFGWLEGRPFRDHSTQNYGLLARSFDSLMQSVIRPLSGESIRRFRQRVMGAWHRIVEENPQGTIVVVGHSAVINQILIYYFGMNFPDGQTHYSISPGSISEIRIDGDGQATLARLNDTAHLNGRKP